MTRAFLALGGLVLVLGLATLGLGDHGISPVALPAAVLGLPSASDIDVMIVRDLRLPRLLANLLVGAALGVAGVVAQAVMRNPLAEPGLLGINGGAATAAMVVMVGGYGLSDRWVPAASFAGAALMAAAIQILSWRNGTSSLRIILIGTGLGALGGSATTLLAAFGDVRDVQRAMVWLAGSAHGATGETVWTLLAWSLPGFAAAFLGARALDLIALGDDVARAAGQRVDLVRLAMGGVVTLLAGAAVAAAGLIAFVGLMAPHLARRMVGHGHGHGRLMPLSALAGAALLAGSDLAGRLVIAPAELPAGIVTALLGAPFLAVLLWERRHAQA